jgi:hypothetical protein
MNRCGPVFDLINIPNLSVCPDSGASSDSQCPVPAQDRVMIVPSTASLDMRFQVDEAIPLSISRQCIVLISPSPGQFSPLEISAPGTLCTWSLCVSLDFLCLAGPGFHRE